MSTSDAKRNLISAWKWGQKREFGIPYYGFVFAGIALFIFACCICCCVCKSRRDERRRLKKIERDLSGDYNHHPSHDRLQMTDNRKMWQNQKSFKAENNYSLNPMSDTNIKKINRKKENQKRKREKKEHQQRMRNKLTQDSLGLAYTKPDPIVPTAEDLQRNDVPGARYEPREKYSNPSKSSANLMSGSPFTQPPVIHIDQQHMQSYNNEYQREDEYRNQYRNESDPRNDDQYQREDQYRNQYRTESDPRYERNDDQYQREDQYRNQYRNESDPRNDDQYQREDQYRNENDPRFEQNTFQNTAIRPIPIQMEAGNLVKSSTDSIYDNSQNIRHQMNTNDNAYEEHNDREYNEQQSHKKHKKKKNKGLKDRTLDHNIHFHEHRNKHAPVFSLINENVAKTVHQQPMSVNVIKNKRETPVYIQPIKPHVNRSAHEDISEENDDGMVLDLPDSPKNTYQYYGMSVEKPGFGGAFKLDDDGDEDDNVAKWDSRRSSVIDVEFDEEEEERMRKYGKQRRRSVFEESSSSDDGFENESTNVSYVEQEKQIYEPSNEYVGQRRLTVDIERAESSVLSAHIDGLQYNPQNY